VVGVRVDIVRGAADWEVYYKEKRTRYRNTLVISLRS